MICTDCMLYYVNKAPETILFFIPISCLEENLPAMLRLKAMALQLSSALFLPPLALLLFVVSQFAHFSDGRSG
jgi:hypothetical protein